MIKAKYAPPKLVDEDTIYLLNTGNSQIRMECTNPDIEDKTYEADELIQVSYPGHKDLVIKIPDTINYAGFRLDGGRNVKLIGAELNAIVPASAENRALMRLHAMRSLFVEGVKFNTLEMDGMDALLYGTYSNQLILPDVYIQNSSMKGLWNNSENIYHADGFQHYGGFMNLRVHNVDIETKVQGFITAPQVHRIGCVELDHVTVNYKDPETASGYAAYLKDHTEQKRPTYIFNEFYVGERQTEWDTPEEELWETYSVFPPVHVENGCVRNGNEISYPTHPEIHGVIKKRTSELFCPVDAGSNYVAGEYQGFETTHYHPSEY